MKQKRLPIGYSFFEFLILIVLTIVLPFYLSGCTTKAIKTAEEKASPEKEEYWEFNRVVSAIKHENGDISVCVELKEPTETGGPKFHSLTIPLSNFNGNTNTIDAFQEFRLLSDECLFNDATCYWYPIGNVKLDCASVAPGTLSSASILPVEDIIVNNKDQDQLYILVDNLSKSQPETEKIYEVRFLFDEEDAKKETNNVNDKVMGNRGNGSIEILIVYWPSQISQRQEGIDPLVFMGGYLEEGGTTSDSRSHGSSRLLLNFLGQLIIIIITSGVLFLY